MIYINILNILNVYIKRKIHVYIDVSDFSWAQDAELWTSQHKKRPSHHVCILHLACIDVGWVCRSYRSKMSRRHKFSYMASCKEM